MKNQAYARDQLKQYLNHAPAGVLIAMFGLSTRNSGANYYTIAYSPR